MRSLHKVSTLVRAYFEVYDTAQNPVTGLDDGDFTLLLLKNGVDDATAISITEVDSGRYEASFTPGSTGTWHMTIRHPTLNKKGWHETFDVTTDGVLSLSEIADAILDSVNAIDGYTPREALEIIGALVAGKLSGTGTNLDPYVFRSLDDTADRATIEANNAGQRTSVTLTP